MADVSIGINAGFPSVVPVVRSLQDATQATPTNFGAVTNKNFDITQMGRRGVFDLKFTCGTVVTSEAQIVLPSALTIDTSMYTTGYTQVGTFTSPSASTIGTQYGSSRSGLIFFDPTLPNILNFCYQTQSGAYIKQTGAALFDNNMPVVCQFSFFVSAWALLDNVAYGLGQATDVKSGVSAGNIGWPGGTDGSAPALGMLGQIIEGVVTAATLTTSYVTYASIVLPKGKFEIRYEASLQPSTGSAAANETYCTAQIESSGSVAGTKRTVAAKTPAASSMYSIGTAVATVEVFLTATTTTYNFQAKVTSPAGAGTGNLLNSLDYQSRFWAKRIA